MLSKRSFFNRTLFRKNLTRFWPLWGGLSLLGSLLPLYMLLALLSGAGRGIQSTHFASSLYAVASEVCPALAFLYAIICAMLIWSYLYSPRSVGLMHTLPVDRTCLFVTGSLSGFAMMLIPYAVVGGLTCLIALAWGFMDLLAAANTVLAVLLMTVTFFGLATFCAMLTGHIFALPVLYALANFLAPLLEALITSLSSEFLIGLNGMEAGWTLALSPVLKLYQRLDVVRVTSYSGDAGLYLLSGFGTLAIYGAAGLALLGLAWLLYRLRASESAGDVAAFPLLRPIFRYGLALLGALTIGRLLYELLWATIFQQTRYANPAAMAVCMALGGVLSYYIASMLLEKSLRVFRGSWRGVAIVCAGAAVICLLLSMDAFGAERRVPDLEDVEMASLRVGGMSLEAYTSDGPELVERILELHRTIVADRDYIRSQPLSQSYGPGEQYPYWVYIGYTFKDGTGMTRAYSNILVTAARMAESGTYDQQLAALLSDPQVIVDQFTPREDAKLSNVEIYCYGDYGNTYSAALTPEEQEQIRAALVQDAQAGNLTQDLLGVYPAAAYGSIELEYRVTEPGVSGYTYQYRQVDLTSKMEHTLQTLIDLGALSEAQVEVWEDQYGVNGEGEVAG